MYLLYFVRRWMDGKGRGTINGEFRFYLLALLKVESRRPFTWESAAASCEHSLVRFNFDGHFWTILQISAALIHSFPFIFIRIKKRVGNFGMNELHLYKSLKSVIFYFLFIHREKPKRLTFNGLSPNSIPFFFNISIFIYLYLFILGHFSNGKAKLRK